MTLPQIRDGCLPSRLIVINTICYRNEALYGYEE